MTGSEFFADQVRRAAVASYYRRLAARFNAEARRTRDQEAAKAATAAAVRLIRAAEAEMHNRPPEGLPA